MAPMSVFTSRLDRRVSLYHEGNQNIRQGKIHRDQHKLRDSTSCFLRVL